MLIKERQPNLFLKMKILFLSSSWNLKDPSPRGKPPSSTKIQRCVAVDGLPEPVGEKVDSLDRGLTFNIQTMGCKVNTYDTSLLEKKLESAGFTLATSKPRVHIINSCAVTEKSSLETHRY